VDAPVESRYKLEDTNDGFKVSGKDRRTAYIRFDGKSFYVSERAIPEYVITHNIIGLFEFNKLCKCIVDILMMDWTSPPEKMPKNNKRNWKIFTWAKERTAIALAKRINAKRLQLMEKADKLALGMQKMYYSATGTFHANLTNPILFTEAHKYVAQDFANYRAAVMTAKSMNCYPNTITWYNDRYQDDDVLVKVERWENLPNWINVYCGQRKPNGPLRKTLTALPPAIPYGFLRRLTYMNLRKPIYNRLELIAYLSSLNSTLAYNTRNILVMERSNRAQVKHAMEMVWNHLRTPKKERSTRKTHSICSTMEFIFDYPDGHNGNIVGLANKSIRWHRERRYLADKRYCTYANDTQVKLPSTPLPTSTNIRLLKTVGEIFEEGDRMSHCVGTYAVGAVEGKSYIFHVDYGKESATVEVSPGGYVKQARGPHNSNNKATKWAERVLNKWAEQLSQTENAEELEEIPF
jgi:hypothetical protein